MTQSESIVRRTFRTTYDSGATETNTYDPDGNLTTVHDSVAGTSSYVYDTLGREIERTLPGMNGDPFTDFDTDYDKAGNVTAVEDPEGDVLYAYDTANQLTSVTEPEGHVTTFGYDANGNETTRTLPNGVVQTTTRDNSGRPVRIRAVNSADTVVSDLAYTYTAPGTSGAAGDRAFVQTRTDHLGVTGPAGSVTSYGYDTLSRLTAATEKTTAGATSAAWAYAYDKAGNRTAQTVTGATGPGRTSGSPAVTTTWAYNDANQITARNGTTAGWSFDANGNQTSSPDWSTAGYGVRSSVLDITTPAGTNLDFEYLGFGNTTRTQAGPTAYTNGSLGLATATTGTDPTVIYRRTPDGQILSTDATGTPRRYYLTDMLGSVVAITSHAGAVLATYAYDPYGNTRVATGPDAATNPIRYTGGHLDTDTGLYKYGARYYDPTTSRFTQMDPSGQENNPYLYAGGNPINYVDPTGLDTWSLGVGACYLLTCIGADAGADSTGRQSFGVKAGVGVGGGIDFTTRRGNLGGSDFDSQSQCGIGRIGYNSDPGVIIQQYSARPECSWTTSYTGSSRFLVNDPAEKDVHAAVRAALASRIRAR